MSNPGKRLSILSEKEFQDIYGLPKFTNEEREIYFSLQTSEKIYLSSLRQSSSRIYFILQLGFFKAKRLFFNYTNKEVEKDIEYIIENYNIATGSFANLKSYHQNSQC